MILLPVGHDKSTVRRLPWVTFGIMAAWLAAWTLAPGRAPWGEGSAVSEPWTWLTGMLAHDSGWLLLGNLLIFYLAGPFLEDVWGRTLFAACCLGSGLAAMAAVALEQPQGAAPLLGASGVVAGAMGAFMVRWGRTDVQCVVLVGAMRSKEFTAPAWSLLMFWAVEQAALAIWKLAGGSAGPAVWAHLGGFAFGVAMASTLRAWHVEERWIEPALERRLSRPLLDAAGLDAALAARAAGQRRRTLELLEAEAGRRPSDPDVVLGLWAVAGEEGRCDLAAPALLELVRREIRAGRDDEAVGYWLQLIREVPDPGADPGLLLRLSRALSISGRQDEALRALRLALLDREGQLTPPVALGLARAARDLGDPGLTHGAARWVLSRDGATQAARLGAEALLAAPATSQPPR